MRCSLGGALQIRVGHYVINIALLMVVFLLRSRTSVIVECVSVFTTLTNVLPINDINVLVFFLFNACLLKTRIPLLPGSCSRLRIKSA